MVLAGIFIAELILLYLCSRATTDTLYLVLYRLTRSRPLSVAILAFVYFPGTLVHELAHLFTAEILGVKTGKLTLVPENLQKSSVETGSVMIAATDPFRRTFIGIAPIVVGIGALSLLAYFFHDVLAHVRLFLQNGAPPDLKTTVLAGVLMYLIYAVSNNMFSSQTDMKGVWPILLFLGLLPIALYIGGFRISPSPTVTAFFTLLLEGLVSGLGIVLVVNLVFLLIGKGLLVLLHR